MAFVERDSDGNILAIVGKQQTRNRNRLTPATRKSPNFYLATV